jgi:hypothetical protein
MTPVLGEICGTCQSRNGIVRHTLNEERSTALRDAIGQSHGAENSSALE